MSHAAAFVRHAFIGGGLRHPDRAGIVRAQECEHDDDLHSCSQSAGDRGAIAVGLRWNAISERVGTSEAPTGANLFGIALGDGDPPWRPAAVGLRWNAISERVGTSEAPTGANLFGIALGDGDPPWRPITVGLGAQSS